MAIGSMMPMPFVAPLFVSNEEFRSTIVLVNGTDTGTSADLILRAPGGTEIARQRVNVSPHSQQQLDVGLLLESKVSEQT
jgi:hypothetical protein